MYKEWCNMSIRRVCPMLIDFSTMKSMICWGANHPFNQMARLLVTSSVLCITIASSALHMWVPTNHFTNNPHMCLLEHMLILHTTLAHTRKSLINCAFYAMLPLISSSNVSAQLSCESHCSTTCMVFHQTSCTCLLREHNAIKSYMIKYIVYIFIHYKLQVK